MMSVMVKYPFERGAPLHFAGRKPELAMFKRFLDNADPSAGVLVVTGVPGVGKSQLLQRFDVEARQAGMAALMLHTSSLSIGDSQLFMQIAEAMGKGNVGARIAHKEPRQTGRRWGLKGGLAGTNYGETTEHVRQEPGLDAMLSALSKKAPARLVVTIDELQNIDAEGAKRLRVLHEGRHGCPVQIVGAGLQHTLDVLRQHGISRTVPPIELGLLARGETYEALVKGYAVGTGAELADDVAELLAKRSQDFPQHVTGYLQGAVQTFERRGDVVGDGIREAVAHGDDVRRRYYDARLDAVGGVHAVLALLDLFDDSEQMTIAGVEEGLRSKGVNGAGIVQEAIGHGMLTRDGSMLCIGIPSFRNHLQRKASAYREKTRREGGKRRSVDGAARCLESVHGGTAR